MAIYFALYLRIGSFYFIFYLSISLHFMFNYNNLKQLVHAKHAPGIRVFQCVAEAPSVSTILQTPSPKEAQLKACINSFITIHSDRDQG